MRPLVTLAMCACLWATNGHATTLLVTEGHGQNRALVAGSTDLNDSKSSLDLNALSGAPFGAGDRVGIHGRIVSSVDSFMFNVVSKFDLVFDFDGYDLANGEYVLAPLSGLIDQSIVEEGANPSAKDAGGKGVTFLLSRDGEVVGKKSYLTNVTSATSDTPLIFGGLGAGTYTLTIDGTVGPHGRRAALYDIELASVPLPGSGLLVLGAFGSLAVIRRQRASVTQG